MKVYFEVSVYGEYFCSEGEKRLLKPYSAVFKLPNAEKPLGIIVGKLLMPYLKKLDPNVTGVYTHHVAEIKCVGRKLEPNEIPVRFQSKEQLREYITYHQLGINVDEYGSVGLLRDHVRLAKEEPDNWPRVRDKWITKQKEEKELFDLNAEFLAPAPPAPVAAKAPSRGKKTDTEDLLG
jgi:hypothetical protein